MDDDILNIAFANLIFGVLALTIGYLYTLPRDDLATIQPASLTLAIGEQ